MKVIIAGSRDVTDWKFFCECLENSKILKNSWGPTIISGCARGPDTLAIRWAKEKGLECLKFPAIWSKGKSAGLKRNECMAKKGDALIALWDGRSRGTRHMIDQMKGLGKPYEIFDIIPALSKWMSGI